MSEPSDQLLPFSSELVIIFLKFLYVLDPVKQLLDFSDVDCSVEVDLETLERVKELTWFGGFSDCEYLQRTLAKEFLQMESCFKEAFQRLFTTISIKILCKDILPLFPHASWQRCCPLTCQRQYHTTRGTIVEKLTEETLRDRNHVMELLSICEDDVKLNCHPIKSQF